MPEKHAGVRSREGRYFEVFWPPSKQFFITQPASKPGFPPHPSTRRLFVQANPSHSCGLHVLQPSQCTTRAQRALAAAEFTAWRRDQQLSPPPPGSTLFPKPCCQVPTKIFEQLLLGSRGLGAWQGLRALGPGPNPAPAARDEAPGGVEVVGQPPRRGRGGVGSAPWAGGACHSPSLLTA